MKNIIKIMLCIAIISYSYNALASNDYSMANESMLNSITRLAEYDIVTTPHKKWNDNDFITRRNAFEMIYIIFTGGHREIASENTYPYEVSVYSDVKYDTYDYYLSISLSYETGLMSGKEDENGNRIADLDSYMTYYESLIGISRLFEHHEPFKNHINELKNNRNVKYPYYVFCKELGLINSFNVYSSLNIKKEMLMQPITGYEFMHLLYNALFIPTATTSCFGVDYIFRYIDNFTALSQEVENRKDEMSPEVFNVIQV